MRNALNLAHSRFFTTRSLLFALCVPLIWGGLDATQAKTRKGHQPNRIVKAGLKATPTPSPSPSPTPNPSASPTPSPIPSASPSSSPSPTPIPSPSEKPWWQTVSSIKWGDKEASGPLIFVVIVFVAIVIFSALVMKKAREEARELREKAGKGGRALVNKWKLSFVWVFILLLAGISLFLSGIVLGSRNAGSQTPPAPTPTPEATSSPTQAPTSTVSPTVTPTVLPTPTSAPTPSQVPSPTLPTPTPTPSPAPALTPFSLSVADVNVMGRNESDKIAGLGDTVIIRVKNLPDEFNREQSLTSEARGIDPRKYVLFLDDMEINKLYPVAFDPQTGAFYFQLNRSSESINVWATLLAGRTTSTRQTKASIGLEGKVPLPNGQNFNLRIYNRTWLVSWLLLGVIAVLLFTRLARGTPFLRESTFHHSPSAKLAPYSLARVQLAWWLFIVVQSFWFIAFMTGDFDSITASSLVLLGIATCAVPCSELIGSYKRSAAVNVLMTIKARQAALVQSVDQLKKAIPIMALKQDKTDGEPMNNVVTLSNLQVRLAAKLAELEESKGKVFDAESALKIPTSQGLLKDILNDGNGAALHRFQAIVWNLLLGVVFAATVWRKLVIPEVSYVLLLLLGLSTSTYLSFKLFERRAR